METTLTKKLQKAKIDLALSGHSLCALLFKLELKEDNTCETFYTDGKVIGYNTDYASTRSMAELRTILCHEVLHVACLHPWRRGNRDSEKFNRAADYAINGILFDNGFLMPADALLDPIYKGLCAEEIYNRLPTEDPNDQGQGQGQGKPDQGQGQGGLGEVRDFPGDTQAEKDLAESEMNIATKYAEKMAQGCGHGQGLGQAIAEVKSAKVDWANLLRQFVTELNKADYSFSRPNRRYIGQGLYLPDLHSQELGTIVLAVDTSASVSSDELDMFFSEINSVITECSPKKTIMIQCDRAIRSYEEYEKGEVPIPKVSGRGGTDFLPVFEKLEEEGIAPTCLIYLTDLDASFSGINPDYPVLWVSTDRHAKAPIGDTVYL